MYDKQGYCLNLVLLGTRTLDECYAQCKALPHKPLSFTRRYDGACTCHSQAGICKSFQPAYAFASYIIVEESVLPNCDCTAGNYIRDFVCYPCAAGTTSGGIVFEDDMESFSACSTCPIGKSIPVLYRGYPANNRVALGKAVTDENECANRCAFDYDSEFFYTYEDTRGQANFCYCVLPVQSMVLAGVAASEVTTLTEACAIVGGVPITSAEECEQAVPFAEGLRKARCDANEQYYCDNPDVTFTSSGTTSYNALGCKYSGANVMWATANWQNQVYTEFCTDGYACVCKIDPPPKAADHGLGPVDFNKYVTYRIDRSLVVYNIIVGGFSIQSTGETFETEKAACQSLGGIPVTTEPECRKVFEQFNGFPSPDGSAVAISNYRSSYTNAGSSKGCVVSGSYIFWSGNVDFTRAPCLSNYQCLCQVPNPGSTVTGSTVNFCV